MPKGRAISINKKAINGACRRTSSCPETTHPNSSPSSAATRPAVASLVKTAVVLREDARVERACMETGDAAMARRWRARCVRGAPERGSTDAARRGDGVARA